MIIVCEKCHSINFHERFIWTCPKCGKKFKDIVNIISEEQLEKNDNKGIMTDIQKEYIEKDLVFLNYKKALEEYTKNVEKTNG